MLKTARVQASLSPPCDEAVEASETAVQHGRLHGTDDGSRPLQDLNFDRPLFVASMVSIDTKCR